MRNKQLKQARALSLVSYLYMDSTTTNNKETQFWHLLQ